MKYDDKRPAHGLDLLSELSRPTVKRDERISALPLLGAQTKVVHITYQPISPGPRRSPTSGEFDDEVALETENILMDQYQPKEAHVVKVQTDSSVDVEMDSPMEKELDLHQVDTISQGILPGGWYTANLQSHKSGEGFEGGFGNA